ncbi:hypothetical protein BCIN_05g02230 [Botrytis cinerea B05.10]|uniref:DUF7918 domain-containing protein n=1 Tax=Botryotinia fuckeliana (strain B05.10) TaxID=332648 RepID=A0A384JGV1_BOTFB|nr:hypothetical protein BCIN_05g02230 [Botrytis cinerea B05.10]ATZ49819.1 hypothetical protein BCIN_05g02230 [Botrytis cinerea B05.10]
MPRRNDFLDLSLPKGVHAAPVPGITAQIISRNNKAFPSYPSPDKEAIVEGDELAEYFSTRTVTTYIAVTNDTPFSIHLRVDRPYPQEMDCSKLQFEIFVDGKFVWDAWCHKPRYQENGSVWEEIIRGLKLGKGKGCEIKDFKFMGLKTNEESMPYTALQRIRKSMAKIGKIEIKVYRTTYGKKGGDVKNSLKGFLTKNNREVPETALKGEAKSHGTTLDEGRKTIRGDVWRDTNKHGELPIIIFRFLYRSEEALKSLHIIEHSPAPSRSSSPENEYHDSTELSAEQTKRVEDLLRSFRKPAGRGGGPSNQMKRKKENESGSRKRIKREEEPESSEMAAKRRRAEKGKGKAVTIDLTADNSGDDQKSGSSEMVAKRRRAEKGKGKAVIIDLTADSGGEDEEKFKVPNVVIDDQEPEVVNLIKDEDDVDDKDDDLFVQDNDPPSKRPLWRGLGLFQIKHSQEFD